MSDEEEERRRRNAELQRTLIRGAAASITLSTAEQGFLLEQVALLEAGGQPTDEARKTTRLLVGKAASP